MCQEPCFLPQPSLPCVMAPPRSRDRLPSKGWSVTNLEYGTSHANNNKQLKHPTGEKVTRRSVARDGDETGVKDDATTHHA